MKTRTIILTIGFLIGLISCAKKNYVIYDNEIDLNSITISSEIIELKRIGITDTNFASISGKIYLKSINKNDTLTDKFPGANILVKDIKSDSIIGTVSNLKGEYQFTIPASEYDLEVQFIGFNNLKIKNIKIGTGEIINFSAILGQGNGVTEYKCNPNGSFEKIME